MRRPAALTFAALFLFSIMFGQAQTQPNTPHPTQTQNIEAPKGEQNQPASETPQKTPEKPQSQGDQQNPFDAFQQFSATLSGGPLHWNKMKIYRSKDKFRAEYQYENEIRISDLRKRNLAYIRPKDWVGKPKECGTGKMMDIASYPFFAYMASDFNVEHAPSAEGEGEKETIDGHPCKVENFTVKSKDGAQLINTFKMWRAEDLNGFPIRMEMVPKYTGRTTKFSYADVSLEPPDPKLFQVPANCPKPGKKAGTSPSSKSTPSKPAAPKAKDNSAAPPH